MTAQIEGHGRTASSPACHRTSVRTVLTLMRTNWMETVRPARRLIIMAAVLLIISPILHASTSLSFSLSLCLPSVSSPQADERSPPWHMTHILLSFEFFQLTALLPSSIFFFFAATYTLACVRAHIHTVPPASPSLIGRMAELLLCHSVEISAVMILVL